MKQITSNGSITSEKDTEQRDTTSDMNESWEKLCAFVPTPIKRRGNFCPVQLIGLNEINYLIWKSESPIHPWSTIMFIIWSGLCSYSNWIQQTLVVYRPSMVNLVKKYLLWCDYVKWEEKEVASGWKGWEGCITRVMRELSLKGRNKQRWINLFH